MEIKVKRANGDITDFISNVRDVETLEGELLVRIYIGTHAFKTKRFEGGTVVRIRPDKEE